MNMNNPTHASLDLIEKAGNFPLPPEVARLSVPAAINAEAVPARPARKSLLAKWLLPPLCLCAIVLIVIVAMKALELSGMIDQIYATTLS